MREANVWEGGVVCVECVVGEGLREGGLEGGGRRRFAEPPTPPRKSNPRTLPSVKPASTKRPAGCKASEVHSGIVLSELEVELEGRRGVIMV